MADLDIYINPDTKKEGTGINNPNGSRMKISSYSNQPHNAIQDNAIQAQSEPPNAAGIFSESCKSIIDSLIENKALDLIAINLVGRASFTDFMIIASGTSARHVGSMATYLCKDLKSNGIPTPIHIEGLTPGDWVLVDSGDVIIHLFRSEVRNFYDLEGMWTPVATCLFKPESP